MERSRQRDAIPDHKWNVANKGDSKRRRRSEVLRECGVFIKRQAQVDGSYGAQFRCVALCVLGRKAFGGGVEGVGSIGGEVGPGVEEEHWAESWVCEELIWVSEYGRKRGSQGSK
jgi:hypothetical protein